ncbi:MAG: MBL fold metallo-hydrolase [Oscillospiraceae bacterium]|nr:MBL fold metallo-hydrolase [Oscillospiraceae bacterium]
MRKRFPKAFALILALIVIVCGCSAPEPAPAPAPGVSAVPAAPSVSESSSQPEEPKDPRLMKLDVIDVGQGSGALLQVFADGETRNIMIDAGERTAQKAVSSHLKKADVDKLDLVIITHPHTDHFGGILQALKDYEVGEVWLPFVSEELTPTNSTYIDFLNGLEKNGCRVTIKTEPEIICISDAVTLELLDAFLDKPEELNNTSLCVRIDAGEASFLITGDAEVQQEDKMREGKENIDVDIFVAGHHGSNSSNKQYFLNTVTPMASVISVGKDNDYSLPSAKAVDRLAKFGNLYRTDLNGTVTFTTDGETITVLANNINDTIDAKG